MTKDKNKQNGFLDIQVDPDQLTKEQAINHIEKQVPRFKIISHADRETKNNRLIGVNVQGLREIVKHLYQQNEEVDQ